MRKFLVDARKSFTIFEHGYARTRLSQDRETWPTGCISPARSSASSVQADHDLCDGRTALALCANRGKGFAALGEARHLS